MKGVNRGKEYWIKCECGSEGLHIEKDACDGDVYFSLWYYGCQNLGWKEKLKWIWYILKGKPYHDTIVVSPERIPEIIQVLEEMK